jgi:hypothetical protein
MIHVLTRWSFGYLLAKLNQNTRPLDTKSYTGLLYTSLTRPQKTKECYRKHCSSTPTDFDIRLV